MKVPLRGAFLVRTLLREERKRNSGGGFRDLENPCKPHKKPPLLIDLISIFVGVRSVCWKVCLRRGVQETVEGRVFFLIHLIKRIITSPPM